jgi:phage-related protein
MLPLGRSRKSTAPRRMKPLEFLGSSRDDLRAMPDAIRHSIGLELMRVQFGAEPTSFKPMPTVGTGA